MAGAQTRLALLLLACACSTAAAQLSQAVAHDSNVDTSGNKFLARDATADVRIDTGLPEMDDEERGESCPQDIALKWHAEATSAIYATPLITDLFSDGRKDIVVPSFLHQLEVFEGRDGAKAPDFEAFHHSTAHTSPLLYDADQDGVPDIVLATYDGEILFFKDNGEEAVTRLTVPRLRVRRDWHQGLNPDPTDHSQPDVGKGDGIAQGGSNDAKPPPVPPVQPGATARRRRLLQDAPVEQQQAQQEADQQQQQQQQQQQPVEQQQQQQQAQQQPGDQQQQQTGDQQQQQQQGVEAAGAGADGAAAAGRVAAGAAQADVLSDEAADSFNELFGENDEEAAGAFRDVDDGSGGVSDGDDGGDGDGGGDGGAGSNQGAAGGPAGGRKPRLPHIDSKFKGHRGKQEQPRDWEHGILNDYDPDYALIRERGRLWEDEFFEAETHKEAPADSPFVYVDAHVLTTPAIADIDGDGNDELVVAVSYFFDRQYYDKEEHRLELGKDIELGKYVASGLVVFDLRRRTLKWSQHLDLSTDFTAFKAYAYSAPTLADLDGDGKLEIIVGTSMGFLYVLDCYGSTRTGFPLQMGDLQAQVAVADINADGQLELVAADARGNVAAFTAAGKEVWETHLSSQVHQNAVFGDVDGDGELEVVLATFSGHVHVLKAATGESVPNFPFRAFGKVMAPPLLTKLDDRKPRGLQIVVTAFDGFLYVIDGISGCADSLDIGETSYGMVLADDLDGNGKLDLLVSTMNGNLYCIATAARYHPLKTWPQQYVGGGTFTARWGWEGVYVTTESRKPRDVRGQLLPLRFKIVDNRPPVAGLAAAAAAAEAKAAAGGKAADEGEAAGRKRKAIPGRGPYKVSLLLTGVGQREMNAGEQPVIGMADILNTTGAFSLEIPCPRSRSTATIRVEMRDESGLVFVDEFSLSFHIHFYRLLKWLIAGPFLVAGLVLLAFKVDMDVLPAYL